MERTQTLMPAVLAENLKYGVSGAEVTQAQSRLKELGYYTDKVDGKFGYSTYLAVKAFQQKNSLKVDGVIGPVTYLALYRADALTAGGKAGGTAAYQRVSYGSEGPAVVTVQNQLRKLGYYKGIVDGKFGYATYMAVRAFQAANGLAVDGIMGPLTWDALTSGLPVPTIPKPAPAPLRLRRLAPLFRLPAPPNLSLHAGRLLGTIHKTRPAGGSILRLARLFGFGDAGRHRRRRRGLARPIK